MKTNHYLTGALLSLVLPAAASAARPDASTGTFRTVLTEDFALFTAGTPDRPDGTSVIEEEKVLGNIPASLTATPGWRGAMVYQAGGSAHIGIFSTSSQSLTGMLITPVLAVDDPDSYFIVSLRAKSEAAADNMEFAMNYGEGSGLDLQLMPITDAWSEQTVTFSADNDVPSLYFTFNTSRSKVLVDDIKVEVFTPYLKAPKALAATGYTGDSFTARWTAVADADEYLLSVFALKADGSRDYAFTDRKVEGTEALVDGLDPNVTYSYSVKARNAQHTSPESAVVTVKGVSVPSPAEPSNATDAGFTAAWEAVPLATNYELWAYHHHTAAEAEDYVLTEEKFSKIQSSGSVNSPSDFGDTFDGNLTPYMSQPGWTVEGAAIIDGAVGMNAQYYYYGVACQLMSPEMDLSAGDGKVKVSFRAWVTPKSSSDHQTQPVISMLRAGGEGNPETVDQYVVTDFTAGRWFDVEATLSNGSHRSQIMIFPYGNEGCLFIDNLKITKPLEAGQEAYKPVYYAFTTDTGIDVACAKPASDCWAYRVRSWRIDGDYNLSDWSDYAHSTAHAGITEAAADAAVTIKGGIGELTVANASAQAVAVADLCGRTVATVAAGSTATLPLQPGIYIAAGRKAAVR